MGRRRKSASKSFNMNPSAVAPPEITADEILADANSTKSETETAQRKSFSYRERDGKIAFDEMPESAKDDLKEFFNRPEVQEQFGTKPESKNDETKFDVDEANVLLDFLQPVLSIGASKIYGVSPKITSKAYVFTENMRGKLTPRMTRLFNKWGPSIFAQYKDEIGFGLILVSCVAVQTKQMKYLVRMANDKKVTQMPTPTPQPVETSENKSVATGD